MRGLGKAPTQQQLTEMIHEYDTNSKLQLIPKVNKSNTYHYMVPCGFLMTLLLLIPGRPHDRKHSGLETM